MVRARLTPELVIDTAAGLADEGGLDGVTMTSVAASLGVGQPALYRHIGGHDDLLRALLGLADRERARSSGFASFLGDRALYCLVGAPLGAPP